RVLSPQPGIGGDGNDDQGGERPEPDAREEIAPEEDQWAVMLQAAPRQQQRGDPAGDQPEPDPALPCRVGARVEQGDAQFAFLTSSVQRFSRRLRSSDEPYFSKS